MNSVKTMMTAGLAVLVLTATAAYAAPAPFVSEAAVSAAKTPAEHEAIAKAYDDEAASLKQKAEVHGDMAKSNAGAGMKGPQMQINKHCKAIAKDYEAAAAESAELAKLQRKLAKDTAK
jgi:hypothetical protein